MIWLILSTAPAKPEPSIMMILSTTRDPCSFLIKIYHWVPHLHSLTRIRNQLFIPIGPSNVLTGFIWNNQEGFIIILTNWKNQRHAVWPAKKTNMTSKTSPVLITSLPIQLRAAQADKIMKADKIRKAAAIGRPINIKRGSSARPETAIESWQWQQLTCSSLSQKRKLSGYLNLPFSYTIQYHPLMSRTSRWEELGLTSSRLEVEHLGQHLGLLGATAAGPEPLPEMHKASIFVTIGQEVL